MPNLHFRLLVQEIVLNLDILNKQILGLRDLGNQLSAIESFFNRINILGRF